MCSVCVADMALKGVAEHKTTDGKIIQFRAKGEGAELPAKFQLKYSEQKWNKKWHETKDLAGVVEELLLDVDDSLAKEDVRNKRTELMA